MYRVLVILLSGILILPGVVNAEVKSEIFSFILKKLGWRGANGTKLTQTVPLTKFKEQLLTFSSDKLLNSKFNISESDYRFLVSAISDRKFLDDFFDPKVVNALADEMPELRWLWQSFQRRSLTQVLPQFRHIYPTVPLELYKRDPDGYMRLLANNRMFNEWTIDGVTMHFRSLLMDQIEQDLPKLVKSAIPNSTKFSQTNLRGGLHEFLSSAKAKEEIRQRSASVICTTWSIKKNSLLSLVVSKDISLELTYDLSKVSAASAVGGGGWTSYITMEKFVGPKFVDHKLKRVAPPNIEGIAISELLVIPDDDLPPQN